MNILDQEDMIKGLDDRRLQDEAKRPSGNVPQFLVVSEIQRRSEMRKKFAGSNQQQPQGTVADQITQEGIASVPPTPMQGQPMQGQPMPMRGGGMTPFMRKYAGGGVVRMQEGGITPNEMLQMDAQIMAQKYPFLSGSRDEILQGLSGIDPNDAGSISSMFGGAPEIDGVLQQVSNRNNLMSQDLSGGLGPAPMVENITPQSGLILDGVMTSTPDGQRPNPNAESVGSLDSFANAFREDAARAENLLATLDDSTAREKEAVSNPTSVNLPQIRTLEEIALDAPQMTPLSARKKNLTLDQQLNMSSQPKGANAELNQARREQLLLSSEMLNGSSGKRSGLSDAPTGGKTTTIGDSEALRMPSGRTASNMQGALMTEERIEELNAPFFDQFDVDLKKTPDERRAEKARSLINFAEQQGSPSRQQLIANSQIANSQSVKPPVVQSSDGASRGDPSKDKDKKLNNLVNQFSKLEGFDLDASKKEAFAMAMIQLGAGIAKGDLAEGLSNAGVVASGVLEKSRDRAGKQMDREIQQKFYDAKLDDARQATNFRMQQAVEKALTEWQVANIGATPEEVRLKREELSRQYQVLGDTTATGSNIGGGNQRGAVNVQFDKNGNRV